MGENGEVGWVKSLIEVRGSWQASIFESFSSVTFCKSEYPYRRISLVQKNPKYLKIFLDCNNKHRYASVSAQ